MIHLNTLAAAAAQIQARIVFAEPATTTPGPAIGTEQVITWALRYVFPLIVLVAVLTIIARTIGNRQATRDTMNVGTQIFLGFFLLAATGTIAAFAGNFAKLILGS